MKVYWCNHWNLHQIVRKTELRKEYELVEAEVNDKNQYTYANLMYLLIDIISAVIVLPQMEIISGIIDQLPNTCPSVDPDHASGIMENGR